LFFMSLIIFFWFSGDAMDIECAARVELNIALYSAKA